LIQGGLFTRDFLDEGIKGQSIWAELDEKHLHDIAVAARGLFAGITAIRNPNEAVTEKDLIYPLLQAIGWGDLVLVQQSASRRGRSDVPDGLLFEDDDALAAGKSELDSWQRFRHGVCLIESKRWNRVLDREVKSARFDEGVPSTQMLRYLRRADDVTGGKLRWGILTNGRHWRLYFQGALSVSEDFLEIDLGKVLDLPGCPLDLIDLRGRTAAEVDVERQHLFKLFVVIFGRVAFLKRDGGLSFHQIALQEGRKWEARVARDLADKVFDEVFPLLADALAKSDPERDKDFGPAYLTQVREATLILLYRLLFVLYAEDRNLLPDESGLYADYCLTRIRQEVAERMAARKPFPASARTYWPRLQSIFRAIAEGDDDLGIPPYNGGLFERDAAPILERAGLSDAVVADVVFRLSHQFDAKSGEPPKYINYRDLSVQQLGSVYEQILEHGLRLNDDGNIGIAADASGRKSSGSYYTPEELVGLIIERAVGPLVVEALSAFHTKAEAAAHDTRAMQTRLDELAVLDPASRLLDLKICDPAMGSGHFLVSLVDWLADRVLAAMEEAKAAVAFAPYASPLAARIEAIRAKILAEAKAHKWPIAESQLDDRHIVRRMVLKRVVYGVDKNPMAVELAKVALWLHSFTVGAPLSFLDHHLRCGDSIVGAWVRPTLDKLQDLGALFSNGLITRVEQVSRVMDLIEDMTDNDVAEVKESKSQFQVVAETTEPVAGFFSLLTAEGLMGVLAAAPRKEPEPIEHLIKAGKPEKMIRKAAENRQAFERAAGFRLALDGSLGDPIRIASGEIRITPKDSARQLALLDKEESKEPKPALFENLGVSARRRLFADQIVGEARAIAARHRFFHWEIGFPNVWSNLMSNDPSGGFDAVIGNPPYVRQELLGEIKPALQTAYRAFDGMADLYVYFYEQGLRLLRPGGRMSYVVTNKWLKAGYAENLRGLFTDPARAALEFIADFGHAKHFFPDADVFPSVVVIRKPTAIEVLDAPPEGTRRQSAQICVIPRDLVPEKGLSAAVAAASYPLPLAAFSKESWTLEPPDVMALLEKIRRNGVPLAEYAGAKPLYGIKTGLNEAFLIDTATRDQLVRDDPKCAEIIKPYLRGQDIERWSAHDSGLFMILMKSSSDYPWSWASAATDKEAEKLFQKTHPSLYAHFKRFEQWIDARTGKQKGLRHRDDVGRFWWELRPCSYYELFQEPKILYVDITWSASFSLDRSGRHTNNTGYFIPSGDAWLASVLNAPIGWWYAWRKAQHGKDEALRYFTSFVETYPIPVAANPTADLIADVDAIAASALVVDQTRVSIRNWLSLEFGLEKMSRQLSQPQHLDVDGFVAAVRAALPKSRKLSAAEVARLRQEYVDTLAPARAAAGDILNLERRLSDLVNAAYGLTPEDVALMWRTAPPRMPLDPTEELRRLGLE